MKKIQINITFHILIMLIIVFAGLHEWNSRTTLQSSHGLTSQRSVKSWSKRTTVVCWSRSILDRTVGFLWPTRFSSKLKKLFFTVLLLETLLFRLLWEELK